jgi:hypothetical protein
VLEVDEPRQRMCVDLDLLRAPAVWCAGRIRAGVVSRGGPSYVNMGFRWRLVFP